MEVRTRIQSKKMECQERGHCRLIVISRDTSRSFVIEKVRSAMDGDREDVLISKFSRIALRI